MKTRKQLLDEELLDDAIEDYGVDSIRGLNRRRTRDRRDSERCTQSNGMPRDYEERGRVARLRLVEVDD